MRFVLALSLAAGLLGAASTGSTVAQESCALCAKEIVINSTLATCFLQDFEQFSDGDSKAVAVDLSNCASRGVIEPLPAPNVGAVEPDTRFMLSRAQLSCLKAKLEDPSLVLDPSAKIALGDC